MKASKTTIAARVEEVLQIILDGAQPWEVRRHVADKEAAGEAPWTIPEGGKPLSERQLTRYVAQAERLMAEACSATRRKRLRRHLARRQNLYAKALALGDVKAALAVLRDTAELEALYPPKRLKVDGNGGKADDAELSDAERLAALQALYARLGAGDGGPPAEGQAELGGPAVGGPVPGDDRGGAGP
jgi:hypothetical protein